MFRPAIRNLVEELSFQLEAEIKERPNLADEYLVEYSIAGGSEDLVRMLDDFGRKNSELVLKHLAFINPSHFRTGDMLIASISMQSPLGEFLSFFDDFINVNARVFLEFKYKYEKRKYFRDAWEKLNSEFFSDEIEITFRSILFQFWYTGGGGIVEDLIPEDNLIIRWQGRDPDGELIVRQLEDAITNGRRELAAYDEQQMRRPFNFLEYKLKVSKQSSLDSAYEKAREVFEKVTYLIRLQSRGGAHYSNIVGECAGNRMGSRHLAIYEPLNQQFIPLGTSEIGWHDIRAFQNAWAEIKKTPVDNFMFQNQKFRDYAQSTTLRTTSPYGWHYSLTIRLEQILDFVQIIESTIGEFGTSNAEYLDKIHNKELQDKFKILIDLRHKYVHGLSGRLYEIISDKYGQGQSALETLDRDIQSFIYISKLTVLMGIINPDIRDKILEYHLERGRKAYGYPRRRENPNAVFPELLTIWHE